MPKPKAIRTKHGYQTKAQKKHGGTMAEANRRASKAYTKKSKKKIVRKKIPKGRKDWYGLGVRVSKDGVKHITIHKNAGDRKGYEDYIKKSKAYQQKKTKK